MKANPDPVVTTLLTTLEEAHAAAVKKAKTAIPPGSKHLEPKELAKVWATLGDADRKRLRQGMAVPGDPLGVRAWAKMMEGK